MVFNKHSDLEGLHAILSPSKYHWLNYNDEKLDDYADKYQAVQKGLRLHAYAQDAIELGIKQRQSKHALNMFINDAIGYKMNTEQVLLYSPICFGTADAISFRQNILRIHDLKTGTSPTSMKQLETYAALFCLEYHYKPHDIHIELRIYQNNTITVKEPSPDEIAQTMERIVYAEKRIQSILNR